jgi:hypothetical protein
MQFALLQLLQLREQVVGHPENQEAAEAISHRREQFAEQIPVKQPHDAQGIRRGGGWASFVGGRRWRFLPAICSKMFCDGILPDDG